MQDIESGSDMHVNQDRRTDRQCDCRTAGSESHWKGDDSVGGQAQEFESRGLENERESIARSHGKKISLILHKFQRHACVEERGELGVRCGML
jgi:hypothetical protein